MSLLQWTSRAVCIEWKRQPSCLHWYEFTTVNQPSCLHWKKAPAELFALRWVYYSEPAELFALRESASRAVCSEMSLEQLPFKYIACYLFATEHNCVHTHFESANLRYHIMFIIVCVHIYAVCMRRKWLILHIKPPLPFCVKSVWEKVCILRIQFYTISLF